MKRLLLVLILLATGSIIAQDANVNAKDLQASALLRELDFHYEVDALESSQQYTK